MGKLNRITLHWTAGAHRPSALDKEHYHFLVDSDGTVYSGDHPPEDNINTADDDYAAHVRNANTGNIGIGLCGMAGAIERPFSAGRFPLTTPQIAAAAKLAAQLCDKYDIILDERSVLTHAEIQPTLGIAQAGKWDITWLPGMEAVATPHYVGDVLRAMVQTELDKLAVPVPPAPPLQVVSDTARISALEAWARTQGFQG